MAKFEFGRTVTVEDEPSGAWALMTDVPRLVDWISVVGDARELEHLKRYTAVIEDKVGMFSLRADLSITLSDVVENQRLTMRAEGSDRQVGSRIDIEALVELQPRDGRTEVQVSGSYEITGKAATLGASQIRRKGEKVIDQFFQNLSREASD